MNFRESAEKIFLAGVKGVLPERIIADLVSLRGPILKIGYSSFDLDTFRNLYVIGAGKASAALGHYVETILGKRITGGQIVTKYGFYCRLDRIKVTEAGHPVPDENSFASARDILEIAARAGEEDLVISIISGGGSSLIADYPLSSSPGEMMFFNDMLVRCGAAIDEMNILRKHLSAIKGGHLARHIWPATSVTIYLSDVPGDAPEIVASGPTVPDNSTFADAMKVIEKYNLRSDIPGSLLKYIEDGMNEIIPDTPKPGDIVFSRSSTHLAGNNMTALRAAAGEATQLGFSQEIIPGEITGDVADACKLMIETIKNYKHNSTLPRPICLLFGGETTVRVTGDGHGGRNQHLALLAAIRLQEMEGVTLLCAGTDGNDGNTEMAGAVVDSRTARLALSMNLDLQKYLKDFNSYSFFKDAGGHVCTGPTMTNVMDIMVAIIE